jgi:hypothetical protein
MMKDMLDVLEAFPFMSYGTMLDREYLGIIQNSDTQLLSMYVYTEISDANLRKKFIELGTQWWWGSNRQTPIHIFHKNFQLFRPCLKHFSRKDFNLEAGPVVSLQETIARRVRKRQITLIRRT